MPVFRHAILLRGAASVSREQLEDIVDIAFAESERYYPAFQFVIWGWQKPRGSDGSRNFGDRRRSLKAENLINCLKG